MGGDLSTFHLHVKYSKRGVFRGGYNKSTRLLSFHSFLNLKFSNSNVVWGGVHMTNLYCLFNIQKYSWLGAESTPLIIYKVCF